MSVPTTVPALPTPSGPDERKARFFLELSAAMEFMALFWSLQKAEQEGLISAAHAAAAKHAQGKKKGL